MSSGPNGTVVEQPIDAEETVTPGPSAIDEIPELAALLPRQSRWPLLAVGVAVGLAASLVAQLIWSGDTDEGANTLSGVENYATVAVETRDLIDEVTWQGDLAFASSGRALARRSGTVTEAIEPGQLIERGDVVAAIDNNPVTAMYGDLPFYRTLRSGLSGLDVQQLETNLVNLGFDPDGTLSVDERFSSNTAEAVERWQEAVGAPQTGRVDPSSILLLSGPSLVSTIVDPGDLVQAGTPLVTFEVTQVVQDVLRRPIGTVDNVLDVGASVTEGITLFTVDETPVVAFTETGRYDDAVAAYEEWQESDDDDEDQDVAPLPVLVSAGSSVVAVTHDDDDDDLEGRPVLSLGTSTLAVTIPVLIADADAFTVGTEVAITLPAGETTSGVIHEVGQAVTQANDQNSSPTIDVTVLLQEAPEDLAAVNTGIVDVETIAERIEGALVVPTRALVALSGGGYAVERIDDADQRELLSVTIGAIDEGFVEITESRLSPGDQIVVPS